MSDRSIKAWLLSPAILSASLIASSAAIAEVSVTSETESKIWEIATEATPLTTTYPELTVSEPLEQLAQVPVNPHSAGVGAPQNLSQVQVSDLDSGMNGADPVNVNSSQQLNEYFREGRNSQKKQQVTSVSQLSDVQPTDWAFQALQSLVERYGCIAGYPDGTYKGNRALTRYEFAAGVNACLERINELIGASTADLVTREDLAKLQRLMEEFAAELAALRGRVTVLEARAAELEANQFSTTTKLRGEVIFFIGDTFGDRAEYTTVSGPNVDEEEDPTQAYFGYRARLNFDTSFTGEDLLRTRLQARDVPNLSRENLTNTLMSRLGTDGGSEDFTLDDLYYRFPIMNGKGQVYFGAKSLDLDDIQDPLSPFQSTGGGASSRFGRYNPTTFRGPEGTGLALKYQFNDKLRINAGYLASQDDAPNPEEGRGLFNGSHSASLQLLYEPSDALAFSLEYNRRYFREDDVSVSGGTGSFLANRPFGDTATTTDNLGVQVNWRVAPIFEVGGWFGATWADDKGGGEGDDLDATIINFAVTLAFPDLLKEGDLGGIIVGMQPKVVYHTLERLEEEKTGIHIEALYRFQLSEYIALIPSVFIVTDPEHTDENDTVVVTTFRTQFRF
ncbi:iron uptake porin [Limnoraphis robusta]|uniref:Membrane protein n=1 Tax=Limnoraphis robusta CS-951 TaxID=1637645 RepID=A0A0F5YIG2_9CYAN|nr:iron uptake porin [Limnoraphis robusta]KKD38671.1 membrane protein [Limnoraphis robusta CS-951]